MEASEFSVATNIGAKITPTSFMSRVTNITEEKFTNGL